MTDEVKCDEERCGGGYGGSCAGGYGGGCGGGCGGSTSICPDDYFSQILCSLKGELVRVLTKADECGVICGRLVTIACDYIAVSCDGTVAYILLCQVTAIFPI